jgi:hypothetical protein
MHLNRFRVIDMLLKKQFHTAVVLLALCLSFLVSASGNSQTPVSSSELSKLREYHKDKDLLIYDWTRQYTFSYNSGSGLMNVKEDFELEFLNLSEEPAFTVYPIFSDDYSKVTSIKVGRTRIRPDAEPYEINGIFHHDARVDAVPIAMLGSETTLPLIYSQEFSDSKYLTRRYLASKYPIRKFKVMLRFPIKADVEVLLFNTEEYPIEKIEYVKGGYKVIEITGNDIPPFVNESQSSGSANYEPHIVILTKSIVTQSGEQRMLATTDDLYAWYASLVDEIGNEPQSVKDFTAELVKNCADKDCEMKKIYYWVQDNIRYFAFEDGIAGFRPESCQSVFDNRYGDCKGMANLLTEMLKSRGFDARLTWIGTRGIPYDYSIPSLAVDNHMICAVLGADSSYTFLDGTEKFISHDDIAERIQGRPVLIEDGDDYVLTKVPRFGHERNEEILRIAYEVSQDVLKGNLQYSVQGEGKVRLMNIYADLSAKDEDEARRYLFSRGQTDLYIGEGEYSDLDDRDADIDWKAPFEARNRVNVFGSKIYLDWDLYKSYSKSMYTEEELEELHGDLDFSAKVNDQERYDIAAIEGYRVKELPKDFLIEDEYFILDVDFTANADGSVGIDKRVLIPKASIPNSKLGLWSESIRRLEHEVYSSPIIYEKQ